MQRVHGRVYHFFFTLLVGPEGNVLDFFPLAFHVAAAVELFDLYGLAGGVAFTGYTERGFLGGELLDDFVGREVSGGRDGTQDSEKNETAHRNSPLSFSYIENAC